MPYSSVALTGSNGVQTYTLTFGVLDPLTLAVTVDAVTYDLDTDWTLNAAMTQITFTSPAFTGGEEISVTRTTDIDDADRPVDFTAGSVLTEENLDNAQLHLLHAIQEIKDDTGEALQLGLAGTDWDAENRKIENLAAPVLASDAARLQDVQDAAIAAGQLPPVTIGDNNSFLNVQAGEWDTLNPASSRTALGLGTSATKNTGTSVGNVVEVQASGELPALGGTNLDLSANADVLGLLSDTWLTPTAIYFLDTQDVVLDATGVAWPTSSTYDMSVVGQVTGPNAGTFISYSAGSREWTLQPGLYRITFGFNAISTLNVGAGFNAQLEGGVYNGNTGVATSTRGTWNFALPNNYPAAGEANAPSSTWQRTFLKVVVGSLAFRIKMANTCSTGGAATGDARIDSSWNAGCLMIEVLRDD